MLDLFLYLRQNQRIGEAQKSAHSAESGVLNVEQRIRALEKEIDLLTLVNQALAEIVSDKLGISEETILAKIEEIDLRDGVKDGQLGSNSLKCSSCGRGYNSRLDKCLYCGTSNADPDSLLVTKYSNR